MNITTNLVDKKDVFDILAIGHLTGFPVLLEGPPGVAKTQVAIDFAKSLNTTIYETQLSFGSRPSEIKGIINIPKLMKGIQETICPIADAEVIFIDEVEKGSPEIRNTLLSIMREREIFLGAEGNRKCKWKLFVGTVNEIPVDEKDNPFWDRFVLKAKIERISPQLYSNMWNPKTEIYDYPETITSISENNKAIILKLANLLKDQLTDRTISYIPKIVDAVYSIRKSDIIDATIKTGSLLSFESTNEIIKEIATNSYMEISGAQRNIEALSNIEGSEVQINMLKSKIINAFNNSNSLVKSIFKEKILGIM